MTRALALLLAVALFALAAPPVGTADDKKDDKKPDPDLKKLQGKWAVGYHETAGKEDTKLAKWVLEVKGDRWTLTDADGSVTRGSLRLDSTTTPKQLSYTIFGLDGDGDEEFVGIYELTDDEYKTCDVAKGKDRPKAFKTDDETGQVTFWKRVKVKD